MKLNRYFIGTVLGLATLGFTACDSKDEPEYTPGTDRGQAVYFGNRYADFTVDDATMAVTTYIQRSEASKDTDYTVQLSTYDESGLFNVPSTASFAAGQTTTSITITFNGADLTAFEEYPIYVTVDEAQASEYGESSQAIYIVRPEWGEWAPFMADPAEGRNGTGVFTLKTMGPLVGGAIPVFVRVMAREAINRPEKMQFDVQIPDDDKNPSEWYSLFTMSTDDGGESIQVPESDLDMIFGGGVNMIDTYTYTGNPAYLGASYFDAETGLFNLNMLFFDPSDGYQYGVGDDTIQLSGFVDTTVYTVALADKGQVEVGGKTYAVVNFDIDPRLDYVNYVVLDGALSEEEVAEAIAKISDPADTSYGEELKEIKKSGNVTFEFPESGEHTIVAVGFKVYLKGTEARCEDALTFSYTLPSAGGAAEGGAK